MKRLLIALACLAFSVSCLAQTLDQPASKDDVILYLRIMHAHDMLEKTMQVQSQSMQQLVRDQVLKDKGSVPSEFDAHFKKTMDEIIRGMPVDEITEAMIPAYQKHFTKSEIEAMNTFYSSPVGQKVLEELPAVMREGAQAAMPIMSKYLSEWNDRMQQELKEMEKSAPKADPKPPQP
jgi:hypothetical protein